ncbi:MAG: hypothetical protein JM58_15660 [Peptococcaceae bacterium BICA1-8]|nr:MAG: hypothetical protein JM58_15660 [Peptococcaceae bacterium BICA1-8]
MMQNILIVVEEKDGSLRKVCEEMLSFCSQYSNKLGFKVTALTYGNCLNQELFNQIASFGVGNILVIEDHQFARYNPELLINILKNIINEYNPNLILFGNTAVGKDLAPRLAQALKVQMFSDVTKIEFANDSIKFTRPIYGGKAIETDELNLENKLVLATVRPNNLPKYENNPAKPGIKKLNDKVIDNLTYTVKEVIEKLKLTKSINEAEIIVSGGRGLKNAENFAILEDLANTLGAAVGASRAAVDAGWKSHSVQVGQTGKTVSPKLYIACGISGAIQHLAGMSTAKCIIAINKDPDAPILKVADFGIVGDLFDIVPLLTKAFKAVTKG